MDDKTKAEYEQWSKQIIEDYKYVFGTPEGRRVLTNMARAAGLFEGRTGDFEAGQRNVICRILNLIEYDFNL